VSVHVRARACMFVCMCVCVCVCVCIVIRHLNQLQSKSSHGISELTIDHLN